jgi:hypothetical protein
LIRQPYQIRMEQGAPRLRASDLGDPEGYHRRLVDYLLRQR